MNNYTKYLPLMLFLLAACSGEKKAETTVSETKAIPVKIEKIEESNAPIPIESSGILAAKEEMRLSFKTGGILENIYVDEGQKVHKGQLLASLSPEEIDSQVLQAKASLEKAKRDLQRAEVLYKDTVVTLEDLQNSKTALEVAQANMEIASFNQQYSKIYASANGRVLQRLAEQNEVLSPGTPVFLLASSEKSQIIRVGLADKDVVKLQLGDSAIVKFDAYDRENFKATVTEIAATASPVGTFEVELSIKPSKYELKQGFVGKTSIYPSNQQAYYKVPVSAIFEADKKAVYVFVPDKTQQTVSKIKLETTGIGENFLIVDKETAKQLDFVITEGNAYLNNGSSIIPKQITSNSSLVTR